MKPYKQAQSKGDTEFVVRTPGLDIHDDDRLGSSLGLGSLLLLVGSHALLADPGCLGVFFVVVITAEQVDFVTLFLFGSDDVWAVGSIGLGGITRQGREFGLVRGDVRPPAGGVGVFGGVGASRQGFEAGNVGL